MELAEVEQHILQSMPNVKNVVAETVNFMGKDANPTLVAFLEGRNTGTNSEDTRTVSSQQGVEQLDGRLIPAPTKVVGELSKRLPGYMVPQVYITVPFVPRSVNGKTDRRKLRELASRISTQQLAALAKQEAPKRSPRSPAELQLQHLWARVLGIRPDDIGVDDNFFQLGGDSVGAMKLVGQARKDGVASLTVASVFRKPTVRLQAQIHVQDDGSSAGYIEQISPFSLLGPHVNIEALCAEISARYHFDSAIEDLYPCTPVQEGLLSLTAKHAGDYVLQNILELPDISDDHLAAFREAWEEVFQSLAILRTRIVEDRGLGLLQVLLRGETIEWQLQTEEILEDFLRRDKLTAMDLGQPLTRFSLVAESTCVRPRWFVWTIHHAL